MELVSPGWVQVLIALLTGGVGLAVVTAVANRKRLGAQTADQLAATASKIAKDADSDRSEARSERDSANRRANRAETRNRAWWVRADAHAVWDRRMMQQAIDAGLPVEEAPPLYPPPSRTDGE